MSLCHTDGGSVFQESEYFISAHPGHMVSWDQRMVRSKRHKYIFNFGSPEEFYDLENDPLELKNVAGQPEFQPEIKRMREALRDWVEKTNDITAKRLFMRL